jgi:hypothetical protein
VSDATYRADTASRSLENDETHRLISSAKVDGTYCYNSNGDQLGTVDHLMIDKISGKVEYVVLSSGGFLGIGESYHPLPWQSLTYHTGMGGYVIAADRTRLEAAPRYTSSNMPDWNDRSYTSRVDDYWASR